MLENLDKVAWANLSHAYGEASDVPALLRDLASSDAAARNEAHYHLYGNVIHQGTVYEATAYVVPFLLELLEAPQVEDKSWILVYLVHLANGNSYWDVHQHLSIFDEIYPGRRESDEFQAEIEQELSWVAAAHQAVRNGIPIYLRLGEQDPSAEIRAAALYTLSTLNSRETLNDVAPRLLARLTGTPIFAADGSSTKREEAEVVRASLVSTLGFLFAPMAALDINQTDVSDPVKLAELCAEFKHLLENYRPYIEFLYAALETINSQPETELVRLVIAITLVRLLGRQAPIQVVKLLVDTLVVAGSEESEPTEKYAELPWADEAVVGEIAGSLCQLEPKLAAEIAVPALCMALHTTDSFTALTLISALLYLTFRQPQTEVGG